MLEISTRSDALMAGRTHYFTGKPCVRGHVCPRFVSTGNCVECGKHRQSEFSKLAKTRAIIAQRPDAHEFHIVQVHPDDVEALYRTVDWMNAQRGRPPQRRPAPAAPARTNAPSAPDERTPFEFLRDLHAGRYDMATIRRLAAQSGIPETYSGAPAGPAALETAAARIARSLAAEGYLADERPTT